MIFTLPHIKIQYLYILSCSFYLLQKSHKHRQRTGNFAEEKELKFFKLVSMIEDSLLNNEDLTAGKKSVILKLLATSATDVNGLVTIQQFSVAFFISKDRRLQDMGIQMKHRTDGGLHDLVTPKYKRIQKNRFIFELQYADDVMILRNDFGLCIGKTQRMVDIFIKTDQDIEMTNQT